MPTVTTPMIQITHDQDTWKVMSTGAQRDGKVYCHLSSTTRGSESRNGFRPVMIGDWIDNAVLATASAAQGIPYQQKFTMVAETSTGRIIKEGVVFAANRDAAYKQFWSGLTDEQRDICACVEDC